MKKLRFLTFTLLLVSLLLLPMRVATAQLKATLEGHTEVVWSVAFSPDGKILASGSWDQTVRLWGVDTAQLLHTLTGHTSEVMSVAFSPDGSTLASGSWDGTIRLWNPQTATPKRTLTDDMGGVGSVAFSPDGTVLASGSVDAKIRLWNTTSWRVERTLTGHTVVVDSVAFSPDGSTLASGSRDKTVRLWDTHTGQHTRTLTVAAEVNRLGFSPDGATFASGSWDNVARLWDTDTGQLKTTLPNQGGWANPVAFSPDGATLLLGSHGISVWDTETAQYKVPLIEDAGGVLSLAFSPDGQTVASGSADNLVRLLDPTPPEVPFANIPFDINNIPEPVPLPKEVRDFFELDPFYQQWINVEGFPVLASGKVNPYAMKEAAWQIKQMIGHRTDILKALAQLRGRFFILAYNEMTTDAPENRGWLPHFFHSVRGRGGGGLFTFGSEESAFGRTSLVVHELAHTIHGNALNQLIDPTFDNRLKAVYNAAMEKGLWSGTFAASNKDEYWADGVDSWFDNSTFIDTNPIKTRDALKAYDPTLALLIAEVFGDNDWRYTAAVTRTSLPHLRGFNPQDVRSVEYPPGMLEAYAELYNPAINERDEWVNLRPYAPSLLPRLNESRTQGDHTYIIWVNLSGADLLLYWVHPDGTETLVRRSRPNDDLTYFNIVVGGLLLVKDSAGRNLAVFQAVEKGGRALVAPNLYLITPGLSKVSGDNQNGVPGAVLANPFVVEVRDENGLALKGISVTFTVTAGGGTLNITRAITDKNGAAQSTLTLGQNLGTNTVSVSAAGIEGTVTFNAVVETAVNIPDPNLRAAVETALGKAAGDPINPSAMARLTYLEARNANISDLTGLEGATNLKELELGREDVGDGSWQNSNSVSDLSPLAGLTQLEGLNLRQNAVKDISALAGLTHLTHLSVEETRVSDVSALIRLTNLGALWLDGNQISDISPLAELTQVTRLGIGVNNISDISALAGLTNLTFMRMGGNNISDLSPLVANTGLGSGDEVDVRWNPLSYASIHAHIPTLQSRGVTVEFDSRTHPALVKISGDHQSGASFVPLSHPFVVEAQDANGSALAGISVTFAVTAGGGTLSTTITRTDANGRAQSTLTLGPNLGTNTGQVTGTGFEVPVTFHAVSDTEAPPITADVNNDGSVNVLDLIVVASELGNTGINPVVDVNRDGVASILDLILVAGMFDGAAAAPTAQAQVPETLTAVEVQSWLTDARTLEVRDPIMKRGVVVLEQLLVSLTPKETELLANYPNPFNPETWIPYHLAEPADVKLTIYDTEGAAVRQFNLGHQRAGYYADRSKAMYWDGRNATGESVASGTYFYHLRAGEYSNTRKMLILK